MIVHIGRIPETKAASNMKKISFLTIFFVSACSTSTPSSFTSDIALEVNQFIEQREACEHFRGEVPDPPNEERLKEISDGLQEFCTGTDAKLSELKKRYSKNQAAMAKLGVYENTIEINKK